MVTRKPTRADQIRDLKNWVEITEKVMPSLIKESLDLDAIQQTRRWTKKERARVDELIDIIHNTNVRLAKAKEDIRAFYAPATR